MADESRAQKVALVTGGGSGIGKAIAERLGADGYQVATIDLHQSDAPNAYAADVTDRAQIDAALKSIHENLGPVSILVNAAGVDGFKPFLKISFEAWERVVNVNLHGVFHMIQAVLPDMIDAGWGRIVNISSSSTHSGTPYMTHYVAAKSGVNGLTKSLALEFGPDRCHRQRHSAGLHRHPDAAQRRRARQPGRHREDDRGHAGAPDGQAGGHRGDVLVPGVRGGRLHHRPDRRRQRRPQHLTGCAG